MIRRLLNWIAERLATPPDVSYSDAGAYMPQALDRVSGPSEYWFCACDDPWGPGRMLNGPYIPHCGYCGQVAPWVGQPVTIEQRWDTEWDRREQGKLPPEGR